MMPVLLGKHNRVPTIVLVLVLILSGSIHAWANVTADPVVLRSPYEKPLPSKDRATGTFDCPAALPPVVRLATHSKYRVDDPQRAQIDQAARKRYLAEVAPAREFVKNVVRLANNYQQRAKSGYGHCALRWLHSWASADALTQMETRQAKLGRGPMLAAFALSYLQLAELPGDYAPERTMIEAWLTRLAIDTIDFMESRPKAPSSRANHRYWNGLGVAAAGIATNQHRLFDWGIDSYRLGIEQIKTDGTLPLELKRGKRARDYHLYAVAPLVMLAELGTANGLDLYGAHDGALHRLVRRVTESLDDATFFEARAGVKQTAFPAGELPSNRLAWLEPYLARFPDNALEQQIAPRRPLSATSLGGNLTLLFGAGAPTDTMQETTSQ